LLLEVRLAVTKLNNEARTRQTAESSRDLKPPFSFQLDTARAEVVRLLRDFQRPPLAEEPDWQQFRSDVEAFVELSRDLRSFGLTGRTRFEAVDARLGNMLTSLNAEQNKIINDSRLEEAKAARTIRLWTLIALLVGAFVAAATIWEVQRWFGRMRSSMSDATRERAFTTQLMQGMVSAVAAIDENDRIRSANVAFFKIFPAASIGASIREKFGEADAMKMLEAATATRVESATYRGRWLCQIPNERTTKSFDVYSSPLAINGDRGQILTLVDATEAAESERVLRRSESLAAVGRATTQVAHEIRNPLGSIRLGVSMLRDSVNDAEALRTIELVERGIKHLNKLVVDVTQFSRQKALERADVDLHELIDRSLDLVADRIADKKTPVEKRFSDRRIMGHWDADQLRQVFVNLLANALDASPEKVPLRLVTEITAQEGHNGGGRSYAKISIIDRGSGMDRNTVDRIFEPFYSTKKRGTGLGLAIVKQIIEQHGGNIRVESEDRAGSTFIVELPL
jgi:signal transduction histidine kinase